ncbi:MAG: hypothetical protein ACK5T0_04875 [Vampirovibrionales bacterium]
MALFFPSPTSLNGSSTNAINQDITRLDLESRQFTMPQRQAQLPQTSNPFAYGSQTLALLPPFNNTVGSFATMALPPLPEKPNYMFVAPSSRQQSMSGGQGGNQPQQQQQRG